MSAKMAHVWSQMIHNYPMIRLNQRWSWQDDRAGRKGRRPRPSDEYHAESLHQGRILQDLPWFWWWIHIPSHSKGSYGSTSSTHKKWRIHCDFLSRCEVDAGVTPLLTPKKNWLLEVWTGGLWLSSEAALKDNLPKDTIDRRIKAFTASSATEGDVERFGDGEDLLVKIYWRRWNIDGLSMTVMNLHWWYLRIEMSIWHPNRSFWTK